MLGYWILLQGVASAMDPAGSGGVAYAAHLGGFASGVLLIHLFANREKVRAKKARTVVTRSDLRSRGW
jgi:membrane associated rhomboid family serine protease